ncbi:MAG: tryptophan synthase subunit alpha [Holosporales bacterium]
MTLIPRRAASAPAAFVPFIMAGDPDAATTLRRLDTLVEAGASLIELGMPFSDPMADGAVIQAAGLRALNAGMTLRGVLEIVRSFRTKHPCFPLILMGYYNPIFRYGDEAFAKDAAAAGASGLLIVDVPIEEDATLAAACKNHGLALVRLIAPTTPPDRVRQIAGRANDFLYYVAVAGITGTQQANPRATHQRLTHIRTITDHPIAVGFGIKTSDDAHAVAATGADGVVVGSALVNAGHQGDRPFRELAFSLGNTLRK